MTFPANGPGLHRGIRGKVGQQVGINVRGFRESPGAGILTRQSADGRVNHADAAATQRGNVGLRRGVLPHFGVHGRDHHHRSVSRQQGTGQQVVRHSGGGPCQNVGGGRGNHHQICFLTEANMVHGIHRLKDGGANRTSAQRLPGRQTNKFERGGRGDHINLMPRLFKQP